ncbi:hypothetical protein N0V82_006038 [Gnomoniopsis sp. IMI 355080]|nr:hypothetical protein N0V82_006038 [Gnomoniopsis sp. IMI 355080]
MECQYLKTKIGTVSPGQQDVSIPNDNNADLVETVDNTRSPSSPTTLNEEGPLGSMPFEVYTSNPPSLSQSGRQLGQRNEALQNSVSPPLNAQDLELLTHYLSHTSQIIPYDKADLYALHIGIPNLAFNSEPLMSSLLALAAVCQCYDFLPKTGKPYDLPLSQIPKLLELAERHHRNSLHQIRKAIDTACYDIVLANATLMTLYGSAVHRVRIRLFNQYKEGRLGAPLLSEFVPAHSQWISLIRAVHCAFIGLRTDLQLKETEDSASPSSFQESASGVAIGDSVAEAQCSQDGPAEQTLRLFLPIVTATIDGAMEDLRRRVWRTKESDSVTRSDFTTCTGALEILESIVAETLPGIGNRNATTLTPVSLHSDGFISRLSLVAPWLRAYTARVTSNSKLDSRSGSFTSSPLRRKITAFLNRVDANFLSLVQEMLERMTYPELEETGPDPEDESAASRCAMDIFAHWLVLMCLLDGVWWIGDIGMWELGRVANYVKGLYGGEVGPNTKTWWPASMYAIRTELAKQRM